LGNVYEPGLEPGGVDMSHSLADGAPEQTGGGMRAIYTMLKPGGVMVCEEADVNAVYAEPSSPAYVELREISLEAGRRRGVDYSGGRRVHSWAADASPDTVVAHCRMHQLIARKPNRTT
jgi:hypothetical protein